MARGQPIDFDALTASQQRAAPDDEAVPVAVREPARESARTPVRAYSTPEPHLRYEIDPRDIPSDMEAQWVAVTVKGAQIRSIDRFYRSGWMPARAADFPALSGYGTKYPEQLITAGLVKNVGAEDPVLDDDKSQILMLRPKELGIRAADRRKREANDLVATQFERLQIDSRRRIGSRTEVRRQFANPDTVPDIATAQEI